MPDVIYPPDNFTGREEGTVVLSGNCLRGNYTGEKSSEMQLRMAIRGEIIKGQLSSGQSSGGKSLEEVIFREAAFIGGNNIGESSRGQFSLGAIVRTPIYTSFDCQYKCS